MSLDAMRGFDMFWLVGFTYIFRALPKCFDNPACQWLAAQSKHPEWHGFTIYDIIFPMFIFIVGAALPFALERRVEQGASKAAILRHVTLRALIFFVLGVVLWQRPGGAHPKLGYYSVLYRIGLSYLFAALIMLHSNIRQLWCWTFGILLAYWLVLRCVPVPGYGFGDFSIQGNATAWLKGFVSKWLSPNWSPVLSLSLLPSISNALFGVLAGKWLKDRPRTAHTALWLMGAGAFLVVAGVLTHFDIPINKNLGTPSFTLLTSGISGVVLALFYIVMDVFGYRKWAFFFVVVGLNPLTIYVAGFLMSFNKIADVFIGGFDFGCAQDLVRAIVAATVKWLFLFYLYRKKVFIRI